MDTGFALSMEMVLGLAYHAGDFEGILGYPQVFLICLSSSKDCDRGDMKEVNSWVTGWTSWCLGGCWLFGLGDLRSVRYFGMTKVVPEVNSRAD